MENSKKKSLGIKITAVLVVCIGIFAILLSVFSYETFYESYVNFYSDKAQRTSQMMADLVDGDIIESYLETKTTDEYYDSLAKELSEMKKKSGAAYMYIFKPEKDHLIYIMDVAIDSDNPDDLADIGDEFYYGDMEYTYLVPDIEAKTASSKVILGADVGFGKSVSAWAPILNKQGELVAMIEVDYSLSEVQDQINSYAIYSIGIIVFGLALIVFIMLLLLKKLVTTPVTKLTEVVDSYQNGHYQNEIVPIKTNDEIQILYEAFCSMNGKIDDYIQEIQMVTTEKERISAELNVATQIQADMLPCIFPAFPDRTEFDLYASMNPAKEVGGDFYDFFMIDDDHLAVVMADVSGKGVPAALFMVIAKTLLKNSLTQGLSVEEACTETNKQLCEGNEASMFVTVWVGVWEISTGILKYSDCGHDTPYLMRKGGTFEHLNAIKRKLPLASLPMTKYVVSETQLHSGDVLFLYTDGVPEATNAKEEMFGMEHLKAVLDECTGKNPDEILSYVHDKVDEFVADAPQFDDLTMLCLEIH